MWVSRQSFPSPLSMIPLLPSRSLYRVSWMPSWMPTQNTRDPGRAMGQRSGLCLLPLNACPTMGMTEVNYSLTIVCDHILLCPNLPQINGMRHPKVQSRGRISTTNVAWST